MLVQLSRKKRKVKHIDLVHVDHSLIGDILERVHTENAKGKEARPLNKVEMSVSGLRGTSIKRSDGRAFRQALLNAIGSSFSDYVAEKRQFAEQVGYEEPRGTLGITMTQEPGQQPPLIQMMLGKLDRVPIDQVVTSLNRFGITEASPTVDARGGYLEMPELTPETATMCFRSSPVAVPINCEVSIYRTLFDADAEVADEHRRIRFVGPFFELEFFKSDRHYVMEPMTIDLGTPILLEDLAGAVRLLKEWAEPGAQPTARVRRRDGSPDLRLGLKGEFSGALPAASVLDTVEDAMRVVRSFGGPPREHVQLDALLAFRNQFRMLAMVLSDNKGAVRLQLGTDIVETRDERKPLAVLCTMGVWIAGTGYAAVLLVDGDISEPEGDRVFLYTSTHRVLDLKVLDQTSEEDMSALQAEVARIAEPLRSEHDVHLVNLL